MSQRIFIPDFSENLDVQIIVPNVQNPPNQATFHVSGWRSVSVFGCFWNFQADPGSATSPQIGVAGKSGQRWFSETALQVPAGVNTTVVGAWGASAPGGGQAVFGLVIPPHVFWEDIDILIQSNINAANEVIGSPQLVLVGRLIHSKP